MFRLTAIASIGVLLFSTSCKKDNTTGKTVINFDNLTLQPDTFWNGKDKSGVFTCGNATFKNNYTVTATGDYWSGFAYSNKHNITQTGYSNQYSVFASEAASNKFVLAYDSVNIVFTKPMNQLSLKVANSTYAALSMKNGDIYAKKFGVTVGPENGDWFKITIVGFKNKVVTGKVVVFLADFTSTDITKNFILDQWKTIDLTTLGDVDDLSFKLSSSDNSFGYMNTPEYFCLDDIEGILIE